MDKRDFDLYIQQFQELDELINNEWLDIKKILEANNIKLLETHLISFMESEEGVQYGILLTKKKEVITFEIDEDENITLKHIQDQAELEELKQYDPSVEAALIYYQ